MAALLVFLFTYLAFSLGRVPLLRSDRTAAAVVGASAMLVLRVLTLSEAQAAVDGATIALLFGMMVLAAVLELSGAFALVGRWVIARARSPVALLLAVSLVAGVLSAFLINDVVCLAFTPLVLGIATSLGRDPKPYLLALATSSNAGSVATITGNPQNILIASLSGLSYGRFSAALAPVAALSLALNFGVLCLVHRRALGGPFLVRPTGRARGSARGPERGPAVYWPWVRKGGAVAVGVLVALVAGAPPALAALGGAALLLLTRKKPQRLYARVDWPLLALFTGLFVVVGGIEHAGIGERLMALLRPLHPESPWGLTLTTAALSNIVSNVPAVMLLAKVVPRLPDPATGWLTLAMSSTLAGNLTLPGSIATVIVVERARGRATVTFLEFLRVGAPSALLSLGTGAAWLWWRSR